MSPSLTGTLSHTSGGRPPSASARAPGLGGGDGVVDHGVAGPADRHVVGQRRRPRAARYGVARMPTYSVGTRASVGPVGEVLGEPGGEPAVGRALLAAAERDVVEAEHDETGARVDDLVDLGRERGAVVGRRRGRSTGPGRCRSRGASVPAAASRAKPSSSSSS